MLLQRITISNKYSLLPPASEGLREVIFSVCPHFWGGYPIQPWTEEGYLIQPWMGGYPNLGRWAYPNLGWGVTPSPWGYPSLGQGYPISGGYPNLGQGGTPFLGRYPISGHPLPPVKGKIFDTRFGLINVQAGKKFSQRDPPPPVKGKIFDTKFGLIHVQTGKKIFPEGLPPSKGKIF